jgi:hypothetical protein
VKIPDYKKNGSGDPIDTAAPFGDKQSPIKK